MQSVAARKAYFRRMERKVAFARRGNKQALMAELYAERLEDLRAVADRSLYPQDPPPQMELSI